jgi:hypothetical protein
MADQSTRVLLIEGNPGQNVNFDATLTVSECGRACDQELHLVHDN